MIVTGDDAFSHALRTVYLHYLLQPRPRRQIPVSPHPLPARQTTSLEDLMRDFSHSHKDPKSIRFPKDFLPILQKRLEAVWMGRDSNVEYKDAVVKRSFASFYTAFKEPHFYDGVAKSRRPEDLILIFYSCSTRELQRIKQDDSWKPLVDRHVALFVRLMSSIIKQQGWSNGHTELAVRLVNLEKKLLRHEDNLAEEGSTSGGTTLGPPEPLSYKVDDMPMLKILSKVFNISLEACQQDIDTNKSVWTENEALQDLKAYNSNLNLNTSRTLQRTDFSSDEAYEAWNKAEKSELSKLMLAIIQLNPRELTKATSGHPRNRASVYDPFMFNNSPADMDAIGLSGSSVVDNDASYIYIPPDPRLFYRHVLDRCLMYDLNDPNLLPMEVPGLDEPIQLLSKSSLDLLDQCALRWRIPKFTRMIVFLDAIRVKYQEAELDLSTLDSAFLYFNHEIGSGWTAWTTLDQTTYRNMLSSVHDGVLRELYDILQHAYDPKATPIGRAMWVLDQHIYSNDLFTPGNVEEFIEQLKEGLRTNAKQRLLGLLEKLPQESDQLDAIHLVELSREIVKIAEKISKRFKEPIMGSVDPMIIFVEVVFPQYTIEARRMIINMAQAYRDRGEEMEIEDGFELYRELSEIRRIFSEAHPTTQFPVSLEEFLVEFPWRWVQTIDSKVIGWVDAAVQHDDIMAKVPEGEILGDERHTSSAVDIFRSFNQPIDYLKKLEWQDDFQYAKLMTAMAKILGKGISRYCEVLEKLFTFEMDRSTPEQEAARSQTTQQKWMAIAKDAWSNKEKVQPFQFAPESCVKLNNIEFAIQQFDKLERIVDADRLVEIIAKNSPPVPQKRKNNYVFTIKIIEAEDLKAMDMNGYSDPYVVLGDEYQKRLAKTRIVYTNLNPRWEESFDITTQGPIWLTATLWDWDTVGDHDCLGRTNLKLDPSNFMDFLPKEFWLDLDTQGRLLLRVSMEGERDDIQFHFGKAFRTLKRTERDMTRQITDKLSAYIHHCLSRAALKSILSTGYSISAVSSLFSRTGLTTGRPMSGASQGVTDADIAAAITPLTDYFNDNFKILNQTLTNSGMTLVMSKLWKEVLITLESLLVPTLSDKPSHQRQLSQQETEVVFKWLQLMYDFFLAVDEATGQITGIPIEVLKSPKYHELKSLNFFYFDTSDNLIRESERMANTAAARQHQARQKTMGISTSSSTISGMLGVPGAAQRSKSIIMKRNLGTMRKAKEDRRREAEAAPNDDMILRILRMRPDAAGYLRDRSRQKERLEAAAAAEAIVRQSMTQGPGRMGQKRR